MTYKNGTPKGLAFVEYVNEVSENVFSIELLCLNPRYPLPIVEDYHNTFVLKHSGLGHSDFLSSQYVPNQPLLLQMKMCLNMLKILRK